MSYQERQSIVSLISTILINALYAAYMIQRYPQADPYSPAIFHFWGSFFLLLIPVTIMAKIVSTILFTILNVIATRETEAPITDERDHLIELKSTRISLYIFSLGFVIAMTALVFSQPPALMFIILLCAGLAAEMISNISQFFFYRRGV
jgi:hypothetical protein